MKHFPSAVMALLACVTPAAGYIDVAPTLGEVIRDSTTITVLKVEKSNREQRGVIFRKVIDLKGNYPADRIIHRLDRLDDLREPRVARFILEWAEPGQVAVCFSNGRTSAVCIGFLWYQATGSDTHKNFNQSLPGFSWVYMGSAVKLHRHLVALLAGKEAVITALSSGGAIRNEQVEYGMRDGLPGYGRLPPIWRVKASLNMPALAAALKPSKLIVGEGFISPEEVPELTKALRHDDVQVRTEAAHELGLAGPLAKAAVPGLLDALTDPEARVRIQAAQAIMKIPLDHAKPLAVLATALEHPDVSVRCQAARALGELGPRSKPAVPVLVGMLKDNEARIRCAAAEAMEHLGPVAVEAIPALNEALKDADELVRWGAAEALGRIAGNSAEQLRARLGGVLVRGLSDPSVRVQRAAALALVDLRVETPAAIRYLVERRLESDDYLPIHVFTQRIGADAVPVLIEVYRQEPRFRRDFLAVIKPCCRRLGEATVPALLPLLTDNDPEVRNRVVATLASLGPKAKAAEPALTQALKDKDERVRKAASEALRRITGN